jgi:hypothetical protein
VKQRISAENCSSKIFFTFVQPYRMPFIKKTYSFILLAIFLFASTPDELIHALAGHRDTIDEQGNEILIGPHHTHCEALQLTLPSFNSSAHKLNLNEKQIFHPILFPSGAVYFDHISLQLPSLRAPPVHA